MNITMKRVAILTFATVVSTAFVGRTSAQEPGQRRWGSETMPSAGVCFFRDKNFRGEYFCVRAGESMAKLGDMSGEISSFRVIGSVDVTVFKDDKFKGPSGHYLTNVRDLKREGWNDTIESLRVGSTASVWDFLRFPVWAQDAAKPQDGACFYKDADFHGDYFCVPRGASYSKVPAGFNDKISSIRIINTGVVMLAADEDFDGRTVRITSDVNDLHRGVWNDRISSIRVY